MRKARAKTPKTQSPPWKKTVPKNTRHTTLSRAEKTAAKKSAHRAGRPYPNLVDNMKIASKQKQK
jgi:hypothetical protein